MQTFSIGPREYEKAFPDSPGVDGVGVKRFGFRQQRLVFSCIYVAADYATTLSNVLTDFNTLANTAFTTAIGSQSFYRCELDASSGMSEPHSTGLAEATFYTRATFVVISKGLA